MQRLEQRDRPRNVRADKLTAVRAAFPDVATAMALHSIQTWHMSEGVWDTNSADRSTSGMKLVRLLQCKCVKARPYRFATSATRGTIADEIDCILNAEWLHVEALQLTDLRALA